MPRVPFQGTQTVAPSGQPQPFQQIQSSPDAFGAQVGQAMQGLGQTVGQASNVAAQQALAFQGLDNEAAAKDADVQFAKASDKVLFDPDNGYFTKKGKDAYDGYQGAVDQLDTLRQSYLDSLQNPEARKMFDQIAVRRVQLAQQSASQHAAKERVSWLNSASDARVQTALDDAANYYNDPNRVNLALNTALGEVNDKADMNGWAPEQRMQAQQQVRSQLQQGVIQRIAVNDPVQALDYYRQHITDIDGAAHAQIEEKLKGQAQTVMALSTARSIVRGQGMPDFDALWTAQKKQESGGDQAAVSGKGALGISQIMPDTARDVAAKLGVPFDLDRLKTDAAYNETLGKAYMQQMLQRYSGNQTLALAAYNAGPGNVDNWIAKNGDPRQGAISDQAWAEKIPFSETQNYVATINVAVAPKQGTIPTKQDIQAHYPDWQAQAEAVKDFGGDPRYVQMVKSAITSEVATIQHGQSLQEQQRHEQLLSAAVGAGAGGGKKPTSLDDLFSGNGGPALRDAFASSTAEAQRSIMLVLEHNAKGTEPPPNPTLYNEALQKYISDPDAFAKEDFSGPKYTGNLPYSDQKSLMAMQVGIARHDATEEEKRQSLTSAFRVSEKLLQQAGINTRAKPGTPDAETTARFQTALSGQIEAARAENGGKRLNDDQITKMVDGMVMQGYVRGEEPSYFNFSKPGHLPGAKSGHVYAFDAPPGQEFYVPFKDIPADQQKAMTALLAEAGKPTDQRSVEAYYMKYRLKRASAKQ